MFHIFNIIRSEVRKIIVWDFGRVLLPSAAVWIVLGAASRIGAG